MTATKATTIKGHCPRCGDGIAADIRAEYQWREENDDVLFWWSTDHRILQCRGCDTVYHQTDYVFSEDFEVDFDPNTGEYEYEYVHNIKYWPEPTRRKKPEWADQLVTVDTDLYLLLHDVYAALEHDLVVLAAIGARTTFDRSSELLGIDPALSFAEKLDALVNTGAAGAQERDFLHVMTEAGSASAHRGWRPDHQQLTTIITILEGFLHRNFILRKDVSDLKNAVPAKPKRQGKNVSGPKQS